MAEILLLTPLERALMLVIQLLLLVTAIDVLIAWVQPDPKRWPRRLFHLLTEPMQRPLRALTARLPLDGWDLSPLLVVLILGGLRLWLIQP